MILLNLVSGFLSLKIAWKSKGPVSVQKFLKIRPNSRVCLLAKHALVSENQLTLAATKAHRNFAQGVNRARELDTEMIRIISGTHNISMAFKRAGLTDECRTGWIVFLDDEIAAVEKKIKRAFSGGQPTIEEHRRIGGNPDIDVAYQYMMYFFEDDDAYLQEINQQYRSGSLLAGEMKQLCIDRATAWLSNHQEMKDQTAHLVDEFFAADLS